MPPNFEPGHVGWVNQYSIASWNTPLSCVWLIAGRCSPTARVASPQGPPCRGILPNEAAARISQFSVCCSGPRFFTSAGRAPPFLRPARLRRPSITAHFSKYGGCPSLQASPSRTIRNARVACRHGPSGLCLPPAYSTSGTRLNLSPPLPFALSEPCHRRPTEHRSLSRPPPQSALTLTLACMTALLTPPRWRGSQRPA